ncbi:hypothetical protein DAMA08_053620 [Martiniozyma asiatica (nom. inval.)]|nr:hypothetical protein DAMA08_053620 [Martiniozyma asiatica]
MQRQFARCFSCSRIIFKGSIEVNSKTNANGSFWNAFKWFAIGGGAVVGSAYTMNQIYNGARIDPSLKTSTTSLKEISPPIYEDPQPLIEKLGEVLKNDQISISNSEIASHSDSYWSTDHPNPSEKPFAIIFPESTQDVSKILQLAHQFNVPIVPYSGGTSLEGHYISTRNGICIDMSRMSTILKLHENDLDVVVQPCVDWQYLDDYLKSYNLLFGPDPGPGACIGGMVGTSCSGTNAGKYGTMRENVIALTVVLADGTIVKTRQRPRKSSCGYNLTNLIVGSEGTLGIVTEITLKLWVRSKFERVAVVSFPHLSNAALAVQNIVKSGLLPNAMELLDKEMMKFVNNSGQVTSKYDELPTIMFKIGGQSEAICNEMTLEVQNICQENLGKFKLAKDEDEKDELWTARKVALWSTIDEGRKRYGQNVQVWTTDVAVPISKLVESLQSTREELDRNGVMASIVSHAADGNYHALIVFPEEQRVKVTQIVKNMVHRALSMEGTATGEHGVGIGKREFLQDELGPEAVNMMRKIKLALDPNLILNPDKVIKIDINENPRND